MSICNYYTLVSKARGIGLGTRRGVCSLCENGARRGGCSLEIGSTAPTAKLLISSSLGGDLRGVDPVTGRPQGITGIPGSVSLLSLDDFGKRKLLLTAVEELLEIIMRCHEPASTLVTSNRAWENWGKLLGGAGAVTAMLDGSPTTDTC